MSFELPELPFAADALEPVMSKETFAYHHGKHHAAYVNKLNSLIEGTDYAGQPLEAIIRKSYDAKDTGVFNNAAQVWNHTFFWDCLSPKGGGKPEGDLAAAIDASFGSYDKFKEEFVNAGMGRFGSGWVWLVREGDKVKIVTTPNAETPVQTGARAVLTCDVWEHAYYLDHQNARNAFLEAFLDKLVNWSFAAEQFAAGDDASYWEARTAA